MASFLDILTMRVLGIVKVSVLRVPAALLERALLTCSVSIKSRKGALDLISACFASK